MPPLSAFRVVGYKRDSDPVKRLIRARILSRRLRS